MLYGWLPETTGDPSQFQKLKGLLPMLRTPEKQGLTLGQGRLSKSSTLTLPSLKEDLLHLKDQLECSLGNRGQMTVTLDVMHHPGLLCRSLVGLHARPHAAASATPTAAGFYLLLSILAAASCPRPPLTTSLLLFAGRRVSYQKKDVLFITVG